MENLQELLRLMVDQNKFSCSYSFDKVNAQNQAWKLNDNTSSIGFIYRHSGEIMLLLGTFLGEATDAENSTMGFSDTGQGADTRTSAGLVSRGYEMLYRLAGSHDGAWWHERISTPFFGEIERIKLFAHILNHNSHHAGQISLTLARHQ